MIPKRTEFLARCGRSHSGRLLVYALALMLMTSCASTMTIEQVDYAQPIESVLPVDQGQVHDVRNGLRFSIASILTEEGAGEVSEVRMIRHRTGIYMLTATGFRHVWYLKPELSGFSVEEQVRLRESGLGEPVFNQRGDWVQLIDRSTGHQYRLTEEGILEVTQ